MLTRANRLSRKRDVERVSRGRPVHAPHLTLRVAPNRLGVVRATVVAGLKVSKRATIRNRAKRIARETIRRHLAAIQPGTDLVVHLKPSAVGVSYRVISYELGMTMDKARILRAPWVDALGKPTTVG